MTRNFYSQSFNRYKSPENYADDKSHGRFDLPHVCVNLGYDFGKGWTMGSEIEFEHGGNGTAVEIEAEEAGEYEAEVEKGGEVNIVYGRQAEHQGWRDHRTSRLFERPP